MIITARKHYRKKQFREREKDKTDRQITDHLRAAVKSLRHGPEVEHLPVDRQIAILTEYAEYLEVEIYDFMATWGADGRDGARHMHTERRAVLESIARLKIDKLRGDDDRHRPISKPGR